MSGDSPLISKLDLGHLLEQCRERAGKTPADVVADLGFSASKVSRIEGGKTAPKTSDLDAMLEYYDVAEADRPAIRELATAARRQGSRPRWAAKLPRWFNRFRKLEQVASAIADYTETLIPGPLQVDSYALALFEANPNNTPDQIKLFLQARAARRARLVEENAPNAWFILDEACLRRMVGGIATMREQVEYLIAMAQRRNITIQIIPFSAGAHVSLGFPFQGLEIGGNHIIYSESLRDAAFVENPVDKKEHRETFDYLKAVALGPAASVEFLRGVLVSLEGEL